MMLFGCSGQDELPSIVADRTACSNCKMLISEPAYATAFRVGDNDLIFDDAGCMLDELSSDGSIKPDKIWVKDMNTDQWIEAHAAHYAYSKALKTPMGFGYVAFSSTPHADASAAKVNGLVLSGFKELQAHYQRSENAH